VRGCLLDAMCLLIEYWAKKERKSYVCTLYDGTMAIQLLSSSASGKFMGVYVCVVFLITMAHGFSTRLTLNMWILLYIPESNTI